MPNLSGLGSVARAVFSAIGGILVALGWVDEQTAGMIVGAIMTIGAALWGWKEKVEAQKLLAAQDNRINYLLAAKTQPDNAPPPKAPYAE